MAFSRAAVYDQGGRHATTPAPMPAAGPVEAAAAMQATYSYINSRTHRELVCQHATVAVPHLRHCCPYQKLWKLHRTQFIALL